MSREFYFGWFSCFIVSQVHMDMMGKTKYLKKVNEYWMDTSVWMWIVVWLVGFLFFIYLEIKKR